MDCGMKNRHAFVIAGTHSGCGKTTVSLALMAALRARGLKVQPFKVGPDFIDPGFHTQAAGHASRNLDGWMLTRSYNQALFRRLLSGADAAVVEGVMGLFDGYDGTTEAGSTAEMAKWLDIPVVLVVDARSMARSAAALVYGFSRFDPKLRLAGVIFNRIGGAGHLSYLREAMAASLPHIPVLGGIPREDLMQIPERHLGLVTADEILLGDSWRESVVRLMERHVDVDRLLGETVGTAIDMNESAPVSSTRGISAGGRPLTVAVARDAAFCFYYLDNLELLGQAGVEIRFFSPLAGEPLPACACGLYLGGGYPEIHAAILAGDVPFREDIRLAARRGMPIYAECGGLMSLGRFIETADGVRYPMAGLLPFGTRMLSRRKALGYTEVELRADCLLGRAGARLRGHEFHYSEIVEEDFGASPVDLVYRLHHRKYEAPREEGFRMGPVLASYVHLHWGSASEAATAFMTHCAAFAEKSGSGEETAS